MSAVYDRRTFRSTDSIGSHIGRIRKAMIEHLDRELEPLDLSTAQSIVIVMLAEEVAASASDLCHRLAHDPGAMTRLLDRLEAKGFLRRVWSDEDRRTARVELTAKGRALYPRIADAQLAVFNRLLRGFTRAEAAALEGYLKRMLENA